MNESEIFSAAVKLSESERANFLDTACKGDPELREQVAALLKAHGDSQTFLGDVEKDLAQRRRDAEGENQPPEFPRSGFRGEGRVRGLQRGERDNDETSTSATESPGTIIAGKYKLLNLIGEGGMGSVWLAEQRAPVKRTVALKLIKAGMDSKAVLARFEAEGSALALMDHPNVARILDGGLTDAGAPFFVMELVKGTPITEFCDARKLTPKQRLELFVPVCQAIQHAHQKGIIHRDIKPSNVLVALYDDRPVPKVIDFGLAKATGQALTEQTLNTGFNVVGTPQYMSPEQATFNQLDIDTRSDIYSLGVLLYELLAGSPPFKKQELEKAGLIEILRVIREEEPPRPSTKASTADGLPSISANRGIEPSKLCGLLRNELDWVVMKALEKDRARRYETANGFAADINRYLAGEAVLAHPPSRVYRMQKFLRKHKGPVLATSLIFVALLAGIIGTTYWLFQAIKQRVIAQQAEAETLFAYQESTNNVVKNLFSSKGELSPNEKAFLENNLRNWESFANHQWDPKRKLAIRARGYTSVAWLLQNLGRKDEAKQEFLKARDVLKELVTQFPTETEYQEDLANAHNNCGIVLSSIGSKKEAQSEYEASCDLMSKLIERFPDNPEYQNSLAGKYNNLGGLLAEIGMLDKAREKYHASADLTRKLIDQFPEKSEYQESLASIYNNFFLYLGQNGLYEEAREKYQASCNIRKKLVDEFPSNRSFELSLAHLHRSFGLIFSNVGKFEDARPAYQAARDISKKLVQAVPLERDYELHLLYVCMELGYLQERLGEQEEAKTEYQTARDILEKLVEQFPAESAHQFNLGDLYLRCGNLILGEGKAIESLEWFNLAIQTLQPVHDKEPDGARVNLFLERSHQFRAMAFDQIRKHDEAVKDWDRAVELSSPEGQSIYRANRARSRVHTEKVSEAVSEVNELIISGTPDANGWYNFACVFSLASGKIPDKQQEYADRAIELLNMAIAAGYKDAAHLGQDIELDPLRERDEFKKLLVELNEKQPTAEQAKRP